MDQDRKQAQITSLKRTRSHIINALDGTNENSNVIKDIDRFLGFLNDTPAEEVTQHDVDHNLNIIQAEIRCSLNCFNHALSAISR